MSACIPTDRLMQTLRTQVPGVTDDMLNLQIFNVVDEFLRRTNAWKEEAEIDLELDTLQYGLPVPSGAALIRVIGVRHNGIPVSASAAGVGVIQQSVGRLTPEQIFPDGDTSYSPSETDLAGGVFTYAVYEPEYITTTAAPDAEAVKYPMEVIMALTLGSTCMECDCGDWTMPEWCWDMYFQNILDGVLGRLYVMPAKPWSNKVEAAYHLKRFRGAMGFRMQESRRGFNYGVHSWRYPRGWT